MTLSTFDHFNVIDVVAPTTRTAFDNFNISSTAAVLPEAPTNLVATAQDASALLTWTASVPGTAAITGYHVVATPEAGTTLHYSLGTATSVVLSGMTNDVLYTIYVYAVTAVGNGPNSDTVEVTPAEAEGPPDPGGGGPDPTIPEAPTLDELVPSDGSLGAYWTEPASDGGLPLTKYIVVATSDDSGTVTVEVVGDAVSAIVGPLVNGVEYTVTVQAVNALGGGPLSNTLSNTPEAGLPPIVDAPGFEPPPTPAAFREPDPIYAAFPYGSPFATSSWITV